MVGGVSLAASAQRAALAPGISFIFRSTFPPSTEKSRNSILVCGFAASGRMSMYVVDPNWRSFVSVAPEHPFPIQNLPYGVFRGPGGLRPSIGVAIGDEILDLRALGEQGLLDLPELAGTDTLRQPTLNQLMAQGRSVWTALRRAIAELLRDNNPTLRDDATLRQTVLVPQSAAKMDLPAAIGDYTDFYSSRYHAENVGTMLRGPENALQPNWLHLPVAYHGRASSIVPSGEPPKATERSPVRRISTGTVERRSVTSVTSLDSG